jgi:hypothetical protein
MTRPKGYTVSAFGPDLLAILIKGAREEIKIPCPDQRTMKHIQMRLQMLRGAMGREKHEQYNLVTRTRTTRTWDPKDKNKDCVLKVYPNDSQFAEIFRAAGIVSTQHERDLLEGIGDPASASEPVVPSEPDPYQKWKKLI